MRSHLVLSNHGGIAPNERGMVVSAAFDSQESNWDLGQYTAWSAYGLHFVNWSGWRRNGRYGLSP